MTILAGTGPRRPGRAAGMNLFTTWLKIGLLAAVLMLFPTSALAITLGVLTLAAALAGRTDNAIFTGIGCALTLASEHTANPDAVATLGLITGALATGLIGYRPPAVHPSHAAADLQHLQQ